MIFLFTDMSRFPLNTLLLKIREASLAGADYIMIRDNQLSDFDYYNLVLSAIQMTTGTRTEIVVCHRDNIGDQLGLKKHNRFKERTSDSFTVSIHSREELAELDHQLFFYSPIFPSTCKPGVPPKGLSWHHDRMIALGGVNQQTVHQLIGVHHIGIMSEWLMSDKLYDLILYYKRLGY